MSAPFQYATGRERSQEAKFNVWFVLAMTV